MPETESESERPPNTNVTRHPHHDDCLAPPQAQSSALFENAAQPPTSHRQAGPARTMGYELHTYMPSSLLFRPRLFLPCSGSSQPAQRRTGWVSHCAQMNDPTQPSAACRHRSLSPCSNAEKMMAGAPRRCCEVSANFREQNACITKIYDPNESIRRKQNFSSANRYPLCSRLSQPPHHGLILLGLRQRAILPPRTRNGGRNPSL